jgi:hypothetical protein
VIDLPTSSQSLPVIPDGNDEAAFLAAAIGQRLWQWVFSVTVSESSIDSRDVAVNAQNSPVDRVVPGKVEDQDTENLTVNHFLVRRMVPPSTDPA